MTLTELVVAGVGTLGGGSGIFSWLKVRAAAKANLERNLDDNAVERERIAIESLSQQVQTMTGEVQRLSHDLNVYRRVSHDLADFSNAACLRLTEAFVDINKILVECGKPERYPSPAGAAMAAIKEVSASMVGVRQAIYDRAEKLVEETELQTAVVEKQKEQIRATGELH